MIDEKKYPYLNIENLLKYENYPWEYDFKNENQNLEYIKISKDTNNALQKFALYKQDKLFDTDGSLMSKNAIDDEAFTCQLNRNIYRVLFGYDDIVNETNVKRYATCELGDSYGPDTINTFMDVGNILLLDDIREKLDLNDKFRNNKFFSNKFFIHSILDAGIELQSPMMNKIIDYVNAITSIGNYCLVPAYFNPFRINYKDYFDLSIYHLKHKKADDIWKSMGKTIFWEANNFTDYINVLFLWDYVQLEDDNYKVKDMFNKNFRTETPVFIGLNNSSRVKDIDGALNFIDNSVWCIKRRGFLMSLLLLLYIMKNEIFLIFKEQLKTNNVFKINDAINKVFLLCEIDTINNEVLDTFNETEMHAVYKMFKEKLKAL